MDAVYAAGSYVVIKGGTWTSLPERLPRRGFEVETYCSIGISRSAFVVLAVAHPKHNDVIDTVILHRTWSRPGASSRRRTC